MKHFDDLLGAKWYLRGLNKAGDFCYVTPGTVEFYYRTGKEKWNISSKVMAQCYRSVLEKVVSWYLNLFMVMAL